MRGSLRAAAVVLLAAAMLLTGCKDQTKPATSPAAVSEGIQAAAEGPHNAYDVMFLQMMIAHQRQGQEMLKLGVQKGVREDVVNLAGAVDAVEAEEAETMKRWLTGWEEPVEGAGEPGSHAAHGASPATGAAELKALQDATGADFELKFLNLLIAHQHNAVEMAKQLAEHGRNATVKQLGERIQLSRNQQIQQMLKLVGG